jgi:histidyl-tRNA synthetase
MKGQFKHADRLGAKAVAIVGDEIEWKDMGTGEQRPVTNIQEAVRIAVGIDA